MPQQINVKREVCARIPNEHGDFSLCLYSNDHDDLQHLALLFGDLSESKDVMVRVHSECFTGETLGSQRCDCGDQLELAMQMIAEAGKGVLIYLRQEGRGIGLLDKLRAYNLQEEGLDTVDANIALGHQADQRDYKVAAEILKELKIKSIRLLTNNPEKLERLKQLGVEVSERLSILPIINVINHKYLMTKVKKMRHIFDLPKLEDLEKE